MDIYLILTPILALAVVALARFVGCDLVFTVQGGPAPPANLRARAGNRAVDLIWDPSPDGGPYKVKSGEVSGTYTTSHDAPDTFFTDTGLENGKTLFYVAVAFDGKESAPTNEVAATPGQGLVTSKTVGTLRNNFSGVAGMLIKVAANPINVVGLGRIFLAGNTGSHVMRIIDGNTGVDLPNATATVDFSLPTITANSFVYGILPSPITLNPNGDYYIVSTEVSGGDQFADLDSTVLTTPDAAVTSAVFGDGVSTTYTRGGSAGNSYGPVDILF